VFSYLNDNELSRAFHALLEFIDNYQYTLEKPLNDYERLLIFLAINQFEFVYKNETINHDKELKKLNDKGIKDEYLKVIKELQKESIPAEDIICFIDIIKNNRNIKINKI
jgi:hypothetical protein